MVGDGARSSEIRLENGYAKESWMNIDKYIEERWCNLSLETKRLLALHQSEPRMFLETLWRLQYARSLTDDE